MALNRLKSGYISNTTHDGGNAANAAVIGYSTANNRVEFIEATVDTSALDTISANVSNYSAQLTANINTIAANADTLVVGVDAAEASLDGVSDNIDSFAAYANSTFVSDGIAANTFVTIETNTLTEEGFSGNVTANVSSDVLTFTAGNGVAFLANAESQSITLAAKLSEIAHDRFTADGTANTFTLSREAAAADELIVYVDGVLQVPANNYTDNRKFPFASITPVINTGSLPSSRERGPAVNASLTHGYYSGGGTGSGGNTGVDTILKYPFASDTDVTDVAELQNNRRKEAGGSSSETHGYVMGGEAPNSYSTSVEKFPFSSDSPSTNIISSGFTRDGTAGSSTTHGYLLGGKDGNYLTANIKKHSFTNDSEVTTVGSLSVASSGALDASSHCANN